MSDHHRRRGDGPPRLRAGGHFQRRLHPGRCRRQGQGAPGPGPSSPPARLPASPPAPSPPPPRPRELRRPSHPNFSSFSHPCVRVRAGPEGRGHGRAARQDGPQRRRVRRPEVLLPLGGHVRAWAGPASPAGPARLPPLLRCGCCLGAEACLRLRRLRRPVIDKVNNVVIATDADGPGQITAEELARRIGKEKCWRARFDKITNGEVGEDGKPVTAKARAGRAALRQGRVYPRLRPPHGGGKPCGRGAECVSPLRAARLRPLPRRTPTTC